jgi:alkaline phosphatase
MTGYARRGNPILGVVEAPGGQPARGADGLPYTVLAYGIGPVCKGAAGREDLTKVDPTAKDFRQSAAYPAPGDTHSGEDVAIWAWGVGCELLRGTMENTETFSIMRRAIGAEAK